MDVRAVAVDAAGGVVLAGFFSGRIAFGAAATLRGPASYVVRLTPGGGDDWAVAFPGTYIQALTIDASGILVAGGYTAAAFGGGLGLTPAGSSDAFVARLGPAGALVWATPLGASETASFRAVSVSGGAIAAGGWFSGTVAAGGALHVARNRGAVALELTSGGGVAGARVPTRPCADTLDGLAVAHAGGAALASGTTLDCPEGELAYVVALDGAFDRGYGEPGDALLALTAASGRVVVAATDGVRRLDQGTGAPRWTFTGHAVTAVSIFSDGRVLAAGDHRFSILAP
jgi:hypothetical protein